MLMTLLEATLALDVPLHRSFTLLRLELAQRSLKLPGPVPILYGKMG